MTEAVHEAFQVKVHEHIKEAGHAQERMSTREILAVIVHIQTGEGDHVQGGHLDKNIEADQFLRLIVGTLL